LFKAKTWEEIKMLAKQDISLSAAAETIYELSEDERIQQECEAREDFLLRQQGLTDTITEQGQKIAEQDQKIAEQDQTIAERDQTIAEQAQAITDLKQEIARLKEHLASQK
jgi:uncharacterized coiled-coil protein SlyX